MAHQVKDLNHWEKAAAAAEGKGVVRCRGNVVKDYLRAMAFPTRKVVCEALGINPSMAALNENTAVYVPANLGLQPIAEGMA